MRNDDLVTVQKKGNPPGFTIPKPPKEMKRTSMTVSYNGRIYRFEMNENSCNGCDLQGTCETKEMQESLHLDVRFGEFCAKEMSFDGRFINA